MKTILTAALVTSIAGAAFAQTATTPNTSGSGTAPTQAKPMAPSTTTAPTAGTDKPAAGASNMAPTTSAASSSMSNGMKMADSATVAVKFITVAPADFMSSRIVGTNVYNNQNETVGEVEDLVIENGKTLKGVVVSVGGFLGMGESYVVLDPSTMVLNQRDGTWRVHVDTSKDSLKNAPKFSYSKMKK